MPISFNFIQNNLRVPTVTAEIDNSNAIGGLGGDPQRILLIGQKLKEGTAETNKPLLIADTLQADKKFGQGSMLARMFTRCIDNNTTNPIWCIALDDDANSTAAKHTLTVTGTATSEGLLHLYIAGVPTKVLVKAGDSGEVVVNNLKAELAKPKYASLPLKVDATAASTATSGGSSTSSTSNTAAAAKNTLVLIAKNKGENGNKIDIRENRFASEETPGGLTTLITLAEQNSDTSHKGSGNPIIQTNDANDDDTIAAMAKEQYHYIAMPYTDELNLKALEDELSARWQPPLEIDGHAFTVLDAPYTKLVELGDKRNNPHLTIIGVNKSSTPPEERAAALTGVAARELSNDPALPLQTVRIRGVQAPDVGDRFSFQQKNLLLDGSGISIENYGNDGSVTIGRLITTYQTDDSYFDVNILATLSRLRITWKARMQQLYARKKLVKQGTGIKNAVTPDDIRSQTISLARIWEENGWIENLNQFSKDIVAEIDNGDPNRVNVKLVPDLVNQLRVLAAKFSYLI